MITDLITLRKIADATIENWYGRGKEDRRAAPGYVIINRYEEACGWTAELDRPESWEPHTMALAVDRDELYLATGGNNYDGATEWKPVPLAKVTVDQVTGTVLAPANA